MFTTHDPWTHSWCYSPTAYAGPLSFVRPEAGQSGVSVGVVGWGRPGVLGPALEDRIGLRALERPGTARNLGLELPRRPPGVTDENPQAVHRLLAAEQLPQEIPARAQADARES